MCTAATPGEEAEQMGRHFTARYQARFASSDADVEAAQRLRYRAFIAGTAAEPRGDGIETDGFDTTCRHVLIERTGDQSLVAAFRLLPLAHGGEIGGQLFRAVLRAFGATRLSGPDGRDGAVLR